MISQIQKHIKKASLILIIITIFFSVNVSPMEAGKCEKALSNCLLDAILNIPYFARVYTDIAYYFNGWIFCIKYLEN